MERQFYNPERILAGGLKTLERALMSETKKDAIRCFIRSLEAEGISKLRLAKYLYHLRIIGELMPCEFAAATRATIDEVFLQIQRAAYAPNTKKDFKVTCKRFFKWLGGGDDYPPEVRGLKCTVRNARRKLPEEMLTPEEVKRLVEATDNARDRALVFTLYESACRIGELGTLRIRNVEFDALGAKLTVNGKTTDIVDRKPQRRCRTQWMGRSTGDATERS